MNETSLLGVHSWLLKTKNKQEKSFCTLLCAEVSSEKKALVEPMVYYNNIHAGKIKDNMRKCFMMVA